MVKNRGSIRYNGVIPEPHEVDILTALTNAGYNISLIPTVRRRGQKTADARIGRTEWEFKTPRGSSTRCIQHIMKKAASQSENLIIDLRQMRLPENVSLRKVKYEFQRTRTLKCVKAITKSGKIVDV